MEDFKTPEMDMSGIRAAVADLEQAHQDLNKARKLRNRGIATFVAGISMIGFGIYKLKND